MANDKEKMKAVGLYKYLPIDHPESLVDEQIDKPKAEGRDLVVEVKAVSVNPVDTKVRSPKERTEPQLRILGWDAAGVVVEAGENCSLFQPGDEVFYAGSITRQGSNSEFQLVDERIVGRKPKSLDFAQAAALPLTSITAWVGLFDRLKISHDQAQNKGKSILIIGAAGGVGSIAVQLAALAGLTVIGTASRPESIAWAKEHGAEYTINHHEPFTPQLEQLGFHGVDYIFCLNNTTLHWAEMAEAIKPQGAICSIVEAEEPVAIDMLKAKSATFVWELMFTRAKYETEDMEEQHKLLDQISAYVDNSVIKTTLTKVLSPLNAATLREAHALVETGSMIGKVVVEGPFS
ncbi:zinc-binding alcohol dehydrogenase family protein [Paenibacillus caui]|uniref:zinc-binding alcohol dehydrogenase family protein n=1 Tax=Paenibacillus caui TaxID=2873927 RepID=UPI001F37BAAC|nr:zinc-binding alcohol dehydrogenase family protein [Paenibacillus caui]